MQEELLSDQPSAAPRTVEFRYVTGALFRNVGAAWVDVRRRSLPAPPIRPDVSRRLFPFAAHTRARGASRNHYTS